MLAVAFFLIVRFVGGIGTDGHDYYSDVILVDHSRVEERFVDLQGTRNTRDIGGYPASGGVVASGMVYRSDNLSSLTDEDLQYLEDIGIRTVIDLRERSRIEKYPNRIPEGADYYIMPIYDHTKPLHIPLLVRRSRIPGMFQDSYIEYLDAWSSRMKPVFELLSSPDAYPVLIHCTNGKDRVGVISALILDLLGVPERYIVSDYSLSNLHLEEVIENFIEHEEGTLLLRVGIPREDLAGLMGVRSRWIEQTLAHLHRRYGSAEGYLKNQAGAAPEAVENLKHLLIETAGTALKSPAVP